MRGSELFQHVAPDPNPGCKHLFMYKGLRCSQSPEVLAALDTLHDATAHQPAVTIVEVGTLYGAFTTLLRDHDISAKAQIHTFDIVPHAVGPRPPLVHAWLGDIFIDQLPRAEAIIKAPGRCFVFCDGGNKEREVNVLSQFLKVNDIILCHDYMKDPAMMGTEPAGFWPGCESQFSNIKDALERHGCVPFAEAAMQRAVWGCFLRVR